MNAMFYTEQIKKKNVWNINLFISMFRTCMQSMNAMIYSAFKKKMFRRSLFSMFRTCYTVNERHVNTVQFKKINYVSMTTLLGDLGGPEKGLWVGCVSLGCHLLSVLALLGGGVSNWSA